MVIIFILFTSNFIVFLFKIKMETYPQSYVDQYLKSSGKLKKIDQAVFRRFAPNVAKILEEFTRLAVMLKDTGINSYAAMCYLGIAKCEMYLGNTVCECDAYLKAARNFLKEKNNEGSLRCVTNALTRCPDDAVLKAAIIRELYALQPHYDGETSNFASLAHRIFELEMNTALQLEQGNFFAALKNLDDIVDNICELKRQPLYEEVLRQVEILQLLLLIKLNLPPARQSPAHIKIIEYFYNLGNFEVMPNNDLFISAKCSPMLQFALAEVVVAWYECNIHDLKLALQDLSMTFTLNLSQKFVINSILENINMY